MRVRLRWISSRKHRILGWTQTALFVAAGVALGFCAFAYLEAAFFQLSVRDRLDKAVPISSAPELSRPGESHPSNFLAGSPIGTLEIPRLDLSVVVIEGVRSRELRLGAGHIPGTALPGEPGNIGIAAHRDTYFWKLRKIQRGDLVRLVTPAETLDYLVEWSRIVAPEDKSVLRPGPSAITLVTCYPFYFVGPAPERFVVRATSGVSQRKR